MAEIKMLTSVAVFCGSNYGVSGAYADGAKQLGRELASRGITLVYGGTSKGLMGVLADETLGTGGTVVGVISRRLDQRGHLHPGLTRHEIADDMRARKARMAEMSDAFIAMPGGLGTLEELFEVATLTQLGDHTKACGALNIRGFYDPMWSMLERAVEEGFLKPEHRDMIVLDSDPRALVDRIIAWKAPNVSKWIGQPGS